MAVKALADGLTILPGIVNMYLIDSLDGLVLIDAGLPDSAGKVLDAVRELGKAPGNLRHIVLTHAHPDHIGSLAALVRATGARTYMHLLDVPIAQRGSGFRALQPAPGLLPSIMLKLFSRPNMIVEPTHIDQQLMGGDRLPIAGGLDIIHVPGHCAGQVAILWTEHGVLFAGDACSNLMGLGPPIGYEDHEEGERSQRKLASLNFDMACFGHGRPIKHAAAARFRKAFG